MTDAEIQRLPASAFYGLGVLVGGYRVAIRSDESCGFWGEADAGHRVIVSLPFRRFWLFTCWRPVLVQRYLFTIEGMRGASRSANAICQRILEVGEP